MTDLELTKACAEAMEAIPECGCWIWTGPINEKGYGIVNFKKKRIRAHRLMYELSRGPIDRGLVIDHLCRVRCCVNPAHMEVVTNKVNVLRGIGRTAANAKKTCCPKGHTYTESNTYVASSGERRCRECNRADQARYRSANV